MRVIRLPSIANGLTNRVRLPVWFWTQIITMFMVLGATLSNSWGVFTIFRSLQGLFGTVPQVVGLPIIHDMYEPEEWPWMINIWFVLPRHAIHFWSGLTIT